MKACTKVCSTHMYYVGFLATLGALEVVFHLYYYSPPSLLVSERLLLGAFAYSLHVILQG